MSYGSTINGPTRNDLVRHDKVWVNFFYKDLGGKDLVICWLLPSLISRWSTQGAQMEQVNASHWEYEEEGDTDQCIHHL